MADNFSSKRHGDAPIFISENQPDPAHLGQMWLKTSSGQLKYWNGSTWLTITGGGGGGPAEYVKDVYYDEESGNLYQVKVISDVEQAPEVIVTFQDCPEVLP